MTRSTVNFPKPWHVLIHVSVTLPRPAKLHSQKASYLVDDRHGDGQTDERTHGKPTQVSGPIRGGLRGPVKLYPSSFFYMRDGT